MPTALTLRGQPVERTGERIGRHRVVRRLGIGGMGEVVEAVDPDLGRRVAAKRMLRVGDPVGLAKFIVEAQVTGQLEHPGIVPVHELDLDASGNPYFTMKAVDGRTLTDVVAAGDMPRRRLLSLFVRLCEAVAFAHHRGVIHRDLKPDNIMVGAHGELYVMDWGLARIRGASDATGPSVTPDLDGIDVEPDALRTLDGTIMGTPAYMPPEQADGRIDDIDARSDVYALGAVLYHVLVGRPPFEGPSVIALLGRVAAGELAPPSAVDPTLPRELDAIVQRAMALERGDRYESVEALREDVVAFLDGRMVAAAQYSGAQRVAKLVRRHRRALLAVVVVALAALAVPAVRFRQQREALQAAIVRADARLDGLPLGADLGSRLRKAAGTDPDARARLRETLREGLADYIDAAAALDEVLRLGGGAEQRARRRAVGEALGVVATVAGDFALADHAMQQLRRWGATAAEVASRRAAVERRRVLVVEADRRARARLLETRHARLAAILAELRGAEADDASWRRRLDDRVIEALSFRDAGSVRRLVARLDALIPDLRAGALSPATALSAAFCARVLGRVDVEAGLGSLGRALAATPKTEEPLAIDFVEALCRSRSPRAMGEVANAMVRFGEGSILWQQSRQRLPRSILLESAPTTPREHLMRALALELEGKLAEAERDLDRGIALGGAQGVLHLSRSRVRRRRGNRAGSEEDLRAAARFPALASLALGMRGLVLHEQGRVAEAVEAFGQVLRDRPRDAEVLANRGRSLVRLGRLAEAMRDLDRAVELAPRNARAFDIRGATHAAAGRHESALQDFDRAIALAPFEASSYAQRAAVLATLGRRSAALRDYARAIELSVLRPREAAKYYFNRGNYHLGSGRLDEATRDYSEALRLDGRLARAACNRGVIHQRLGDLDEALRDYSLAIEVDPRYAMAYVNRAAVYLARKKPDLARSDIERALALGEGQPVLLADAYRMRAELTTDDGSAMADVRRALTHVPRAWKSYRTLGVIHRRAGRWQEAVAAFEKAASLAPPGERAALRHLAEATRSDR